MSNNSHCFVSNDFNLLSSELIKNICLDQVFSQSHVFVDGVFLKEWLQLKIASKLQVCFYDLYCLKFCLKKLFNFVGVENSKNPFSSIFFWSIYVFLKNKKSVDISQIFDASVYIRDQIHKAILSNSKNIETLLSPIAFEAFSFLFSKNKMFFDSFEILNCFQRFKGKMSPLHIFGVSFLSPLEVEILRILKKTQTINIYAFSPCALLWENTRSSKDVCVYNSLTDVEKRCNSMVSLMAKACQFFVADLEEIFERFLCIYNWNGFSFSDVYDSPKCNRACNKSLIIKFLQKSILVNSGCECKFLLDESLSFHFCSSPFRQIEVALNLVKQILNNGANLSQIVVVAPNILDFEGHINSNYGLNNPPIEFNIETSPREFFNSCSFLRLLFELFDLENDIFSLIYFFRNEVVMKTFGFSALEVEIICNFIKENFSLTDKITSFDQTGLLFYLLGGNCRFLESKDLCQKFFSLVDPIFNEIRKTFLLKEQKIEAWVDSICRVLDILSSAGNFYYLTLKDEVLSFFDGSFDVLVDKATFLKSLFFNGLPPGSFNPFKNFNTLLFANINSLGGASFDHVIFIGMDEESFPKVEKSLFSGFCVPSSQEVDRFRFLQIVLSAKKSINFIYSKKSQGHSLGPCDVLKEIISWTSKITQLKEEDLLVKHPKNSFDRENFLSNSPIKSFSDKSFCSMEKNLNKSNLSSLVGLPILLHKFIDIKDLVSFFISPTRFFIRKKFGCFYEKNRSKTRFIGTRPDLLFLEKKGSFVDFLNKKRTSYLYKIFGEEVKKETFSVSMLDGCNIDRKEGVFVFPSMIVKNFYICGKLDVFLTSGGFVMPVFPSSEEMFLRDLPTICLSAYLLDAMGYKNRVFWLNGSFLDIDLDQCPFYEMCVLFVNSSQLLFPHVFKEVCLPFDKSGNYFANVKLYKNDEESIYKSFFCDLNIKISLFVKSCYEQILDNEV